MFISGAFFFYSCLGLCVSQVSFWSSGIKGNNLSSSVLYLSKSPHNRFLWTNSKPLKIVFFFLKIIPIFSSACILSMCSMYSTLCPMLVEGLKIINVTIFNILLNTCTYLDWVKCYLQWKFRVLTSFIFYVLIVSLFSGTCLIVSQAISWLQFWAIFPSSHRCFKLQFS